MNSPTLALIFLVVLVSGCTSTPASPAAGTVLAPASEASKPITSNIQYHITGADLPGGRKWYADPDGGNVMVPANATALLMEVRGTCTLNGPCDLHMILFDPNGKGAKEDVARNANGSLLVPTPAPGKWNAQVWPESTAMDSQGEIRVTVFSAPVPEGFTAFR